MSDVRDILGEKRPAALAEEDAILAAARGGGGRGGDRGKGRKSQGGRKAVPRALAELLSDTDLPPMVAAPSGGVRVRRGGRATRWAWRPFTSSARRDGLELSHWVRAASEFPDYPFARFNKRVDIVRYTDEEYRRLLLPVSGGVEDDSDSRWTREHTDLLLELCRRFDLRWPVIHDRFHLRPHHSIEDMQQRFYTVSSRVLASRAAADEARSQTARRNPYCNYTFRAEVEGRRRRAVDKAFRRRQEAMEEERALLQELRLIDRALEKLRVAGPESVQQVALTLAHKSSGSASAEGGEARGLAQEAALAATQAAQRASSGEAEGMVALPIATPGAQPAVAEGELPPAHHGEPRGGWKAWTSRAKPPLLDAFRGVSLRSEQLVAAPDAFSPESRSFRKITTLLGELGVPPAHKMTPCGATLLALTRLRRSCAALFQLQRAVRNAEKAVRVAQWRRRQICVVRLAHDDALDERRAKEQSASKVAAAVARATAPRTDQAARHRARITVAGARARTEAAAHIQTASHPTSSHPTASTSATTAQIPQPGVKRRASATGPDAKRGRLG